MFTNLPEFKEPFVLFTGRKDGLRASMLRPGIDRKGTSSGQFRAHDCSESDAAKFARESRQSIRKAMTVRCFRRMAGTESHQVINQRSKRVGDLPLRAERRKLARAFAADQWNKRKAVA